MWIRCTCVRDFWLWIPLELGPAVLTLNPRTTCTFHSTKMCWTLMHTLWEWVSEFSKVTLCWVICVYSSWVQILLVLPTEYYQVTSHTNRYNPASFGVSYMYTRVNKNPSAWNFLSPKLEVTCGTVAIKIWAVLLSPYLHIRAISLSSIHYN